MKYSARRLGATACWIASGLVLLLGTAASIDAIIRLDPDSHLYSVGLSLIFFVYGWVIALAFILAGCALLLSSGRKAGVVIYLTTLGVISFGAGMTMLRQTDWDVVMLLVATGSFYVVWRQVAVLWQKQASLASALVAAGTAIFQAVPLPAGVLVLAGVAILLLNIRRVNERLEGPSMYSRSCA